MFKQNFKIYVGLSEVTKLVTRLSVAIGGRIVHLMIKRRAVDASVILDSKEMGLRIARLHQVMKDCRQNLIMMKKTILKFVIKI